MGKILCCLRGVKVTGGFQVVQEFIGGLEGEVKRLAEEAVMGELEQEVEEVLGRAAHQRRRKEDTRLVQARCWRCGERRQQRMRRNGHRRRELATHWGVLTVWQPRVVCECGGSVRVPFTILEPYQRVWSDVDEQIQRWGEWGLSLRQMQAELSEWLSSSVGLRTINQRLQAVKQQVWGELSTVPPILLLDAIWVTLLRPTGEMHRDKQGRWRPVKVKRKVAVLIALGVWGRSGDWQVLDWQLAEDESKAAWEGLLARLEERGVYRERGLELIIHDGGKGLAAALNFFYPTVPHQRCVFHKLRNIWQAIAFPDDLSLSQQRDLKMALIRQAAAVFYADSRVAALTLVRDFRARWFASQPAAVLTLERDLADTLRFFDLIQRFPAWRPSSLRTTSPLERVNRHLRRLFRAAGAYHSDAGLLAATARSLLPYAAS